MSSHTDAAARNLAAADRAWNTETADGPPAVSVSNCTPPVSPPQA